MKKYISIPEFKSEAVKGKKKELEGAWWNEKNGKNYYHGWQNVS